jgi:prepilin-type N-terminal cleavage/methylation domain-containing protein
MFLKSQKGFTIIELIVVIAIIAVLAAIVLVNVQSYSRKAKDAAMMADIKQISVLATDYFAGAGNGSYSGLFSNIKDKMDTINNTFVSSYNVNSFTYHFIGLDQNEMYDHGSIGHLPAWQQICANNNAWVAAAFTNGTGGATSTSNNFCIDSKGGVLYGSPPAGLENGMPLDPTQCGCAWNAD